MKKAIMMLMAITLGVAGLSAPVRAEETEEIPAEEEEAACLDVLRKKYRFGIGPEDRKKAFAYLARRGFSFDSIGKAMEKLGCSLPGEETGYGDND